MSVPADPSRSEVADPVRGPAGPPVDSLPSEGREDVDLAATTDGSAALTPGRSARIAGSSSKPESSEAERATEASPGATLEDLDFASLVSTEEAGVRALASGESQAIALREAYERTQDKAEKWKVRSDRAREREAAASVELAERRRELTAAVEDLERLHGYLGRRLEATKSSRVLGRTTTERRSSAEARRLRGEDPTGGGADAGPTNWSGVLAELGRTARRVERLESQVDGASRERAILQRQLAKAVRRYLKWQSRNALVARELDAIRPRSVRVVRNPKSEHRVTEAMLERVRESLASMEKRVRAPQRNAQRLFDRLRGR